MKIPSQLTKLDLDHMLECAAIQWNDLAGASIFITGGTGFVGKWLLESILYANQEMNLNVKITLLSRSIPRFIREFPRLAKNSAVRLMDGDVRDFIFPKGDFTHVIHAATDVIAINSALETFDVIVDGTRHVLDFCVARDVKNMLLLSSGAIYGKQPPMLERVPEDFTGAPEVTNSESAYGIGKRSAEWLSITFAKKHNFSCKIARCFAFVGPYLSLDKQFAVGNFIRDALLGREIQIGGDGTPLRSYLYAADLSVWLWSILLYGQSGIPYNVGSDHPISILDLAMTINSVISRDQQMIKIMQPPALGAFPERYIPDISCARKDLGLDVWIRLEDALRRSIGWYR